jgi:hypothetical protein
MVGLGHGESFARYVYDVLSWVHLDLPFGWHCLAHHKGMLLLLLLSSHTRYLVTSLPAA